MLSLELEFPPPAAAAAAAAAAADNLADEDNALAERPSTMDCEALEAAAAAAAAAAADPMCCSPPGLLLWPCGVDCNKKTEHCINNAMWEGKILNNAQYI